MKQQKHLSRPSIPYGLALILLLFSVIGFIPTTQAAPMAADYTITTLGGVLVVTDVSGNGETLTVSESGGGNILFSVPGRNFSIDGGPDLLGSSGSLSLAGVTNVIINLGNGDDALNVGAFTGSFPSLTINGDAANDTINLNGDITFATDANLDLDLQNDSASSGTDVVNMGTGANLLTTGSGTITIKCSRNVTLASGSSLETEDGGVTIETNQQAIVTAGTFVGIDLNNATIRTTGAGNVSLLGKSGNTLDNNIGIRLQAGAQVLSTQATSGAGSLNLNGVIPGGRAANFGVQLTGAATLVSSVSGPITVTGLSGGTGGTGGNYGVVMADGATIRSTGVTAVAAPITVTGTGGGGNQTNHGIYLDGSASDPLITSVAGAISVTGTGGTATGPGARGILLSLGGRITSTGTGATAATVTVTGFGGTNGTNNRRGIHITGAGSQITSVDGAIVLNGTGGTGGSGTGSRGVSIDTAAVVQATGAAPITITGVEGTAGTLLEGISVESVATSIATNVGSGAITLIANQMFIDTTNPVINAGTNNVVMRQRTNGRAIAIGGTDSGTQLGLTDGELDRVTAGTLTVGDANSGAITISAVVSPLNYKTLALGNNATFSATGGFLADIGPTAATYEKMIVTGTLSINTSAALTLAATGGYTPASGDAFTLVNNDAGDAITGNFSGLPENALIPSFLGSSLSGQISYVGGSGNDLVLTVVDSVAIQCGIQAAVEPADYTFFSGADQVTITVTGGGTNLDCIRVTAISGNHPNATTPLLTGKFWRIQGLQSDQNTAAVTDFTVNLTLPFSTADDQDRLCRYTGSGWNCAATSFVANTSVTRVGITEFSDWTIGDNAGPTAVTLSSLSATNQSASLMALALILSVLVLALGTVWLWRRAR